MRKKKKILFVCLGNICRSPLAEELFRVYVEKKAMGEDFEIDSAGISGYHQGEKADPRMIFHASKRGYNLRGRSRKFTINDFEKFDFIVAMDDANVSSLQALAMLSEDKEKIYKLSDFHPDPYVDHVPDPYYGGAEGFDRVIDIVEEAIPSLYDKIMLEL